MPYLSRASHISTSTSIIVCSHICITTIKPTSARIRTPQLAQNASMRTIGNFSERCPISENLVIIIIRSISISSSSSGSISSSSSSSSKSIKLIIKLITKLIIIYVIIKVSQVNARQQCLWNEAGSTFSAYSCSPPPSMLMDSLSSLLRMTSWLIDWWCDWASPCPVV